MDTRYLMLDTRIEKIRKETQKTQRILVVITGLDSELDMDYIKKIRKNGFPLSRE